MLLLTKFCQTYLPSGGKCWQNLFFIYSSLSAQSNTKAVAGTENSIKETIGPINAKQVSVEAN
jgi:hypothetical protein